MTEDATFFGKLKKVFPDLLDLIKKNNYVILEPKRRLILEAVLTKNFYYNHIFYKSPYDESLYINLNGRVLKYEHPKFKSYLGWSKEMILTIKESTKMFEENIQCFQLDNVCDDINYTESKSTTNKNQLQKKSNMAEYVKYNQTLLKSNENYAKNYDRFKKFIKEMKNNYMFMKGYEDKYSAIFNERKYKLIKKYTELLKSTNDEYNVSYNITSELMDSIIFNEMYQFLFVDCLVKFYSEEEKKIRKELKDSPSRYDWDSMKVSEVYYKCKFQTAIQYLKNISSKKTIFEKMEVLNDVNNLIIDEAKNIYESQKKKNFILDGNDILQFWIYVIAHCDTPNILAEAQFVSLFGATGYNSQDYIAINFASAAKGIKDEILKNDNILSQYVEPNIINLEQK